MYVSFFPRTDDGILSWANKYKVKIPILGPSFGMTPDEIEKEIILCDNLIDAVNAVATQRDLLKGVVQTRKDVLNVQGALLRTNIGHHKTSPGYTEAKGKELGVVGSNSEFDPDAYKPVITLVISGGGVQLKFRKKGADGINIYRRKKGTADWIFLSRATKSPYHFLPSSESDNQPIHWEFRSYGVVNDIEIGQPSDIVELIFGT